MPTRQASAPACGDDTPVWRVEVRDVRRHDGLLRWTLIANTPDVETLVYVDSTTRGGIVDLQSDEYCGTSGDLELDDLCVERIRREIASRHIAQRLDGAA